MRLDFGLPPAPACELFENLHLILMRRSRLEHIMHTRQVTKTLAFSKFHFVERVPYADQKDQPTHIQAGNITRAKNSMAFLDQRILPSHSKVSSLKAHLIQHSHSTVTRKVCTALPPLINVGQLAWGEHPL